MFKLVLSALCYFFDLDFRGEARNVHKSPDHHTVDLERKSASKGCVRAVFFSILVLIDLIDQLESPLKRTCIHVPDLVDNAYPIVVLKAQNLIKLPVKVVRHVHKFLPELVSVVTDQPPTLRGLAAKGSLDSRVSRSSGLPKLIIE